MVGEWGRVWMGDLGWLGGGLGKAVGEGDIHSATTHSTFCVIGPPNSLFETHCL